jgi:hypothetical protein
MKDAPQAAISTVDISGLRRFRQHPKCGSVALWTLRLDGFFPSDLAVASLGDAECARFRAGLCGFGSSICKSSAQQFSDCSCSTRHAHFESPVVQGCQFLRGKHDLQPLFPISPAHVSNL